MYPCIWIIYENIKEGVDLSAAPGAPSSYTLCEPIYSALGRYIVRVQ